MGAVPVTLAVVPERGERRAESGGRFVRVQALLEVTECHSPQNIPRRRDPGVSSDAEQEAPAVTVDSSLEDQVIAAIESGFARTTRPAAAFIQGSRDGCEPGEAVAPFLDLGDWRGIPPAVLDGHYDALSFFSEGGFRFFLPAYLVADVRDQLMTADPVFHLTHGFHSISVTMPDGVVTTGGASLLNPRRYGAITWEETARFRLSV